MDESSYNQHNAHVATVAAAYLGNPSNPVERSDIADVIRQIDSALKPVAVPEATAGPEVAKPTLAEIRKSITPQHLISFLDGRPYKSLKRHLAAKGHTPKSYREHFGLKPDYPTTAPEYSAHRAALAKQIGLGQRGLLVRQAALAAPLVAAAEASPAKTKLKASRGPKGHVEPATGSGDPAEAAPLLKRSKRKIKPAPMAAEAAIPEVSAPKKGRRAKTPGPPAAAAEAGPEVTVKTRKKRVPKSRSSDISKGGDAL